MNATVSRASVEECGLLRRMFYELVEPLEIYRREAREYELNLYTEQHFSEIIKGDEDAVWIASLEDIPVGFSITERDCDLWWLSWFGVTEQGRGHRIGHKLVANVIDVARSRNTPKVWCDTRAHNSRSISILLEIGFEKICVLPNHWYGEDYILWQMRPSES